MTKVIFSKIRKQEILLYVFFGALTTFVSFLAYWIALRFGARLALANTISHAIAITFAYITNKIWVFKSLDVSIKVMAKEYIAFFTSRIATYVLDTLLLIALVYMLRISALLARIFTSALVVILNYVISRKLIFGKNKIM